MYFYSLYVLFLCALVSGQFAKRIQDTQAALLAEGPSLGVLSEFSLLIRDIENHNENDSHLPQLYFKRSLIEINLSKEKQAILDLQKALSLDLNLRPAKEKLIDLLIETSNFDQLIPYLTEARDKEVLNTIEEFNKAYASAVGLIDGNKYRDALSIIENQLLPVAPLNATLYNMHIQCLKHTENEDGGLPNTKKIIQDYGKLVKLEPNRNLQNYRHLSEYLLFTELSFEKSFNNIKQCLRIDNEFQECTKLSKFFSKFSKVLSYLETYSIELGHIYVRLENQNDASIDHSDVSTQIDFNYVVEFLLEEKPKLRGIPDGVETNYEYLVYLIEDFIERSDVAGVSKSNIKILDELNRMVCEAFVTVGKQDKTANKFCNKVPKDPLFFPKYVADIDKMLKNKQFEKAEAALNKFAPNVRRTQLYKLRQEKLTDFIRQREQRQRQAQQERFRQQQQQQRQHQQRQHQMRSKPSKPKNDYYKVLDIPRDADDKTIKKGYRTQTLKYHPDKYKGSDFTPEQMEKKMQDINEAYEVLSDPELRNRYDRGDDPNDPMGGGGGGGHQFRGNPAGGNSFGGGGFKFGGGNFFNGQTFHFGGFGGPNF